MLLLLQNFRLLSVFWNLCILKRSFWTKEWVTQCKTISLVGEMTLHAGKSSPSFWMQAFPPIIGGRISPVTEFSTRVNVLKNGHGLTRGWTPATVMWSLWPCTLDFRDTHSPNELVKLLCQLLITYQSRQASLGRGRTAELHQT